MERSADATISHVTTTDELLGSIESLECIMLETWRRRPTSPMHEINRLNSDALSATECRLVEGVVSDWGGGREWASYGEESGE
ncbi:hypothetical protein ACJ73_01035 [Blastomyces percursus]|uniref:Uncharacterized protein n=1 Tax=Blastomyces percursus TaxID=1658174 RepID=A0A1J9QGG9_9EURO|nr:hypothetical protein ACJ73_01035 [Blastomyces percursus]